MAYGNYGAFVYKNGIHRKDRENVAVFDDHMKQYPSGARIWANLLEAKEKYGDCSEQPWHEHIHHAVLGDSLVRICGYKENAELWKIDEGKIIQIKFPEPDYSKDNIQICASGEIGVSDGRYNWAFWQYNENMINLWLREPDGSNWFGVCGYQYGAGHMEEGAGG